MALMGISASHSVLLPIRVAKNPFVNPLLPLLSVPLTRTKRSSHGVLRIEATRSRARTREENAKVRNRRLQRRYNGTPTMPRLSMFCSDKQLYAMLIDDQNNKTLFYASTLQKSIRQDPPCNTIEAAQRVGEELVKACAALKISEISSYDRNGFACGERMKAFEIAIAEHGFLN